jgi:hypothetical protein
MTPLRALRMHESRGKVNLTLMTDRIIWRVRRREVTRVSSHNGREQRRVLQCLIPCAAGSKALGCKGWQSHVEVADVRLRERGTVSICRPSPAFPPLRGREGKCERRHEHRSPTLTAVLVDAAFFLKRAARIYGDQTPEAAAPHINDDFYSTLRNVVVEI